MDGEQRVINFYSRKTQVLFPQTFFFLNFPRIRVELFFELDKKKEEKK